VAHFLLTPVGSSGDVHPFIGIGRGLRAGHDVTMITAEPFREVAERAGFRFIQSASRAEFDELTRHPDLWHSRKGLAVILQAIASHLQSSYALIEAAYEPGRTVSSRTRLPLALACSRRSTARPLHDSPRAVDFSIRFSDAGTPFLAWTAHAGPPGSSGPRCGPSIAG
jgi:hypothetical protein